VGERADVPRARVRGGRARQVRGVPGVLSAADRGGEECTDRAVSALHTYTHVSRCIEYEALHMRDLSIAALDAVRVQPSGACLCAFQDGRALVTTGRIACLDIMAVDSDAWRRGGVAWELEARSI
jgi:hypothetical protein